MTTPDMHVWFRQYAQQMGMQNVRAILPEQIDILINSSITDKVNQIIKQNVTITNGIVNNAKLGQINALRNLYDVKLVNASVNEYPFGQEPGRPFISNSSNIFRLYGKIENFNNTVDRYYKITNDGEEYYSDRISYDESLTISDELDSEEQLEFYRNESFLGNIYKVKKEDNELFKCFYLSTLSINYKKDNTVTQYFPIRIIDDAYLANTLNDFALRPQLKDPIAVVYNNQLDVYIDKLVGDTNKVLPYNVIPNEIRVSYIKIPAKVRFDVTTPANSDDCDLPEYMHVDILKHAADLYKIAVNGDSYNVQQAQGRNIDRNQIRPQAEGYQS